MKKLLNLVDVKLLKFFLVGVTNTAVGWIIMFGLHNAFGVQETVASAANYILTSILSYFLNKYFTFRNTEKGWKPTLRFALNIAVCWCLSWVMTEASTWVLFTFMDAFGLGGVPAWVPDLVARYATRGNLRLLTSSGLFVVCNYLGQRLFAFRERKEK